MASNQHHDISHKAGETAGHAQEKSEGMMDQMSNAASGTAQQASQILQQTGESVKNMASGAADAVKNTLGMNNANNPGNSPSDPTAPGPSITSAVPSSTATTHK